MKDKRLEAIHSLTNGGVRFRLPAPFYLKWLKPKLTIKPNKAGTILEFSKVILENDLEKHLLDNNLKTLVKSVEPVAECLAISALNSKTKIRLFKNFLKRYLLWQVDKSTLVEIFLLVAKLNDGQDFIHITKYHIHQMKTMMSPNLGQE